MMQTDKENLNGQKKSAAPGRGKGFTVHDAVDFFNAEILEEKACRSWVLGQLHGTEHVVCPECKTYITGRSLQSFWSGGRVKCPHCGKWFTALTGTAFSGVHCSYKELFFVALCLGLFMTNKQIAEKIGYSAEAVRLLRKKFGILGLCDSMQNGVVVGVFEEVN